MSYNADKDIRSRGACQGPEFNLFEVLRNPLLSEAIRLGGRVVSVRKVGDAAIPGLVRNAISGRFSGTTGEVSDSDFIERWLALLDKKRELMEKPSPEIKGEFYGRVRLLKEDVEVQRRFTARSRCGTSKRGKITSLSYKARHRLLLQARNVDGMVAEATLTWPAEFPTDGLIVKRNLWAMLHWLTRRGIGGMWFLEFQERGAPHFHVFLDGKVGKVALSAAWYRIVKSGDEKHLRAGTRIAGIRKPYALAVYAAKYAAKMAQKTVPEGYSDVGRFWGLFGGLKVKDEVIASGKLCEVASVIRLIRRAYVAARRSYAQERLERWTKSEKLEELRKLRRFHDHGDRGFTAWGVAPGIRRRLSEVLTL
jgi:hypothetical protein